MTDQNVAELSIRMHDLTNAIVDLTREIRIANEAKPSTEDAVDAAMKVGEALFKDGPFAQLLQIGGTKSKPVEKPAKIVGDETECR